MGFWAEIFTEDDIDRMDFQNAVLRWLETVDVDWTLEAEVDGKIRPVGIIMADVSRDGRRLEPHVDWFPWATDRIKLECSAHWLLNVRKEYKVFVYSRPEHVTFWERMKRHRIIQRACKLPDYYGIGDDVLLYYTQGPFA